MTHLKFDSLDRRSLTKLDPEFEIDASGEAAVIEGNIKIEIVRIADDRFELTIEFSELDFPILISRTKTLEQFGIKGEA